MESNALALSEYSLLRGDLTVPAIHRETQPTRARHRGRTLHKLTDVHVSDGEVDASHPKASASPGSPNPDLFHRSIKVARNELQILAEESPTASVPATGANPPADLVKLHKVRTSSSVHYTEIQIHIVPCDLNVQDKGASRDKFLKEKRPEGHGASKQVAGPRCDVVGPPRVIPLDREDRRISRSGDTWVQAGSLQSYKDKVEVNGDRGTHPDTASGLEIFGVMYAARWNKGGPTSVRKMETEGLPGLQGTDVMPPKGFRHPRTLVSLRYRPL
ncbi:hypothetical protein OE88DRAFT_1728353 [Heliocybe sulcata]|uniref:Uncharacterized protein n=1 Tax=Heliocybe sulcata TaxID=5364 RepID=A0A5C3MQN9_9AGAM|nr:hypothetical protein OE88DRAFT_1728353 [Heliocybe sulcata]